MNDTCIEFEYTLLDENAKCPFSSIRVNDTPNELA